MVVESVKLSFSGEDANNEETDNLDFALGTASSTTSLILEGDDGALCDDFLFIKCEWCEWWVWWVCWGWWDKWWWIACWCVIEGGGDVDNRSWKAALILPYEVLDDIEEIEEFVE